MGPPDVDAIPLKLYRPGISEDQPTTPICISGMHRSGTSMVARLLHDCGVFLGPEHELNQPVRGNPEGYCENLGFVSLNDELMAHFGGNWNDPPRFPTNWEFAAETDAFIKKAEALLGQFSRHIWGWKDPRNLVTLPFWLRLFPDLKIIVCVRQPLEVARSLFVRGDTGGPSDFRLWSTYYHQLLSTTAPTQRLVTHYQSYFHDPRAELQRVLDWIGLEVSHEAIERACARISLGLRHHYVITAELNDAEVPDDALNLYWKLCAEAGPVYWHARKFESADQLNQTAVQANEVRVLMNELQQLRSIHEEILNSKTFKAVSWFWRLRSGKRPQNGSNGDRP